MTRKLQHKWVMVDGVWLQRLYWLDTRDGFCEEVLVKGKV